MAIEAGSSPADIDLEAEPEHAADLCRAAHARLLLAVHDLDDRRARQPSRLPGWSVGHVLTHLARNADAHARRLAGALQGDDVAKYPGGSTQREREILEGAGRPAKDLVVDLANSQKGLEELFSECSAAGWPGRDLREGAGYPVTGTPAHRLREVEIHHVDLGLGYEPSDWPPEYVAWDLPWFLGTVPERLPGSGDRATLLAWLAGRARLPNGFALDPI